MENTELTLEQKLSSAPARASTCGTVRSLCGSINRCGKHHLILSLSSFFILYAPCCTLPVQNITSDFKHGKMQAAQGPLFPRTE